MAKYDRLSEPLRKAKSIGFIDYEKGKSEEKTLRQMDNHRKNEIIYYAGYKYGLKGYDFDQVDAEYREENGEVMRIFRHGYLRSIEQFGFDLAYKGGQMEDYPHLVKFPEFVRGYQKGIDRLTEKNKKK